MARSNLRLRTPSIEHLESRVVLSASGPNHEVTLMIDNLSRMRSNPAEAAEWVEEHADALVQTNLRHYGVDLNRVKAEIASKSPRQPLAFSPELNVAAQRHSDDMARNNFQSHTGSDGSDLSQRLESAGYQNRLRQAENAFAYADSLDKSLDGYLNNAMEAFLIDWGVADAGHRKNILEPGDANDANRSDEVGIGLSLVEGPIRDRAVVVQNFGSRQAEPGKLTGVVFEDVNGDGSFSYKEGRSDAEIQVRNVATDATKTVQPWDAGMYQIPLEPGQYEVSIEIDGKIMDQKPLTMEAANKKVDFNVSELRAKARSNRDQAATLRLQAQQVTPSKPTQSVRIETSPVKEARPETSRPEVVAPQKVEVRVADRPKVATFATKQIDSPGDSRETQILVDLIASGLIANPSTLTINSSSSWRAR